MLRMDADAPLKNDFKYKIPNITGQILSIKKNSIKIHVEEKPNSVTKWDINEEGERK